jgi:hypothetical protein
VFHKKEWPTLIQILVLERDISYFAKNKTIWFYQNVLWNWYRQHARVFLIVNIFVLFGWRVFQHDSRHTYGYKLCSSSRRFVPIFVWGSLHTVNNACGKYRSVSNTTDWFEPSKLHLIILPSGVYSVQYTWSCSWSITISKGTFFDTITSSFEFCTSGNRIL